MMGFSEIFLFLEWTLTTCERIVSKKENALTFNQACEKAKSEESADRQLQHWGTSYQRFQKVLTPEKSAKFKKQ